MVTYFFVTLHCNDVAMEKVHLSKDENKILCVSKKHWTSNILPIAFLVVGCVLLIYKIAFWGYIVIFASITKILSNRATTWTLSEEKLIIRSGFLSWKKTYFEIPREEFYEAFYSKSFWGMFLGYAQITIRRNEGITSSFSSKRMTNFKDITTSINTIASNIKKQKAQPQSFIINQNISVADEIQKLVHLKAQGILSEEEFNIQKERLLQK